MVWDSDYSGINGMGLDENMPYGIFLYQKSFYMYVGIVSIYAASMAVWVMSGFNVSHIFLIVLLQYVHRSFLVIY